MIRGEPSKLGFKQACTAQDQHRQRQQIGEYCQGERSENDVHECTPAPSCMQ